MGNCKMCAQDRRECLRQTGQMPASGMRRRDGQKDQGEDTDNQMQDKG